jgi:hypothetical protein
MLFRSLSPEGDWNFGRGKVDYALDERSVELNLLTRIKSWKGNCFFDWDAGIDWTARMDKNQKADLIAELKRLIIQSYGVVGVNSVTVGEGLNRSTVVYIDVGTIFSPSFTSTVAIAAGVVGG